MEEAEIMAPTCTSAADLASEGGDGEHDRLPYATRRGR